MALPKLKPAMASSSERSAPPSDLAVWSEAAVCDRLIAHYDQVFTEAARASQAARLHWACWRCSINGLTLQGRASRQALARLLAESRLDARMIEAGDEAVIDEISDLVLQKFRRAPQQAKHYVKCLIAAAEQVALLRERAGSLR